MKKLSFIIFFAFTAFFFLNAQQGTTPEQKARLFLELLVRENYEEASEMFNAVLISQLPAERLAMVWNSVQLQVGKYRETTGFASEESGGYLVIIQTCQFETTPLDLRLVFDSQNMIGGIFFAPVKPRVSYRKPDYDEPSKYREEKVEVVTGEFRLPAILTIPKGEGLFPSVVLVHGSGAHDKDATIGPNKVFADLAAGLSSNGIAVLRYDKRNFVYGEKAFDGLPVTIHTETIADAISAVSFLMKREDIHPGKVYLLGHSLGAMAAPRIASQLPQLAGIIMMAGNYRPLEDLIFEQVRYLQGDYETSGTGETHDEIRLQVELVKKLSENPDVPASSLPLNVPAAYWLDLQENNQAEIAQGLSCRILILQGERDYQVTMKDYELWKESLSTKSNASFLSYPTLNHLFHEGSGKSTPAEYNKAGNIPWIVIRDILDWLE